MLLLLLLSLIIVYYHYYLKASALNLLHPGLHLHLLLHQQPAPEKALNVTTEKHTWKRQLVVMGYL